MYPQYAFEGDIHASLDCVPMAVRRKLDLARLKISLAGWQALDRADRLALCHLPVDGDGDLAIYVEVLQAFAARVGTVLTALPSPDLRWRSATLAPDIAFRFEQEAVPYDASAWTHLDEDARYAIVKLADPKRAATKLIAAAVELGLCSGTTPEGLPSVACGAATAAANR